MQQLNDIIERWGVSVRQVETTNLGEIKNSIGPNSRLLWVETPTNPLLRLCDIAGLAELARDHNLLLACDNTFATPVLQNPLALGADLVIPSATKYLGGHSDWTGGGVIENDRLGHPETTFAKDSLGLPYTTLGYANGPGYTGASDDQPEGPKHAPHSGRDYKGITNGRPDLTSIDTADPGYLQECATPLSVETHGGEDVPLYAGGPHAHLFHGVPEQNVIFHVMVEALRLQAKPPPTATP